MNTLQTYFHTYLTPWRATGFFIFLAFIVYVPGMSSIPPIDRDESRYVQASRQMVETGDWINIQFQDQDRHKKPIGIYWLQSLSVSLFAGDQITNITWYRLVSVMGALIAVIATFWFALSTLGLTPAFLGSAFLALSVGVVMESHMAKTDAMLLASIVVMQGALWRLYVPMRHGQIGTVQSMTDVGAGSLTIATFWAALGLGILIKGPVSLMVAGATICGLVLWDRSLHLLKVLKPLPYALWTVVIVAPWFIAITVETDGRFFIEFIGHDFLGKISTGQEGHGAPFGTHTLLSLVYFFPGTLLFLAAFKFAIGSRRDPNVRFLLAWLIPAWLIVEIMSTKLPNYAVPMYPAIALLVGLGAARLLEKPEYMTPLARWVTALIWMLVATILPLAVLVLPTLYDGDFVWWSVPGALLALILAAGVARDLIRRVDLRAFVGAFAVACVSYICVFGGVLPSLNGFFLSRSLAVSVQENDGRFVALAGYHEPSAVFMLGTQTLLTDATGVANALHDSGAIIGAVERSLMPDFEAAAETKGLVWLEIDSVAGFNYSRGKQMELAVIRRGVAQ